ncbi:hypothetical protein JCM8097_001097 [Rhodosporidiobolus ruineniae]
MPDASTPPLCPSTPPPASPAALKAALPPLPPSLQAKSTVQDTLDLAQSLLERWQTADEDRQADVDDLARVVEGLKSALPLLDEPDNRSNSSYSDASDDDDEEEEGEPEPVKEDWTEEELRAALDAGLAADLAQEYGAAFGESEFWDGFLRIEEVKPAPVAVKRAKGRAVEVK